MAAGEDGLDRWEPGRAIDEAGRAGYIAMKKRFVLRKPQTLYRMTEKGRAALTEYVSALKELLGSAI